MSSLPTPEYERERKAKRTAGYAPTTAAPSDPGSRPNDSLRDELGRKRRRTLAKFGTPAEAAIAEAEVEARIARREADRVKAKL